MEKKKYKFPQIFGLFWNVMEFPKISQNFTCTQTITTPHNSLSSISPIKEKIELLLIGLLEISPVDKEMHSNSIFEIHVASTKHLPFQ